MESGTLLELGVNLVLLVATGATLLWRTGRVEKDQAEDRKRIEQLEKEMERQKEKSHGLSNAVQVLGEKLDRLDEKLDRVMEAVHARRPP